MAEVVITGYASLDYPALLDGTVAGDSTTQIRFRDPGAWPRLGGSPAYAGAALARGGHHATPVSWIASDTAGETYVRMTEEAGMATDALARIDAPRSPVSLMLHQADGTSICLYDPGFAGREVLTPVQRDCLSAAAHVCVTVGPGHLLGEILDLVRPDAALYWVAKNDPTCFTPALCARLSARAQVIFCNHAERALIAAGASEDQVVIETMGRRGYQVDRRRGHLRRRLHRRIFERRRSARRRAGRGGGDPADA
jgi:ribokinase